MIAHDIRSMIETALKCESMIHDKLLHVFLTVYDKTEAGGEAAGRGVRRAQICLASFYLVNNKQDYAK